MNQIYTCRTISESLTSRNKGISSLIIFTVLLFAQTASAQGVTGIVTDYNGYWKSDTTSVNPVKPDNSHNLLAFTYKGVTYSTGVNDGLLTSRGQSFISNDFWSLPVANLSGTVTGNTKVGLGE